MIGNVSRLQFSVILERPIRYGYDYFDLAGRLRKAMPQLGGVTPTTIPLPPDGNFPDDVPRFIYQTAETTVQVCAARIDFIFLVKDGERDKNEICELISTYAFSVDDAMKVMEESFVYRLGIVLTSEGKKEAFVKEMELFLKPETLEKGQVEFSYFEEVGSKYEGKDIKLNCWRRYWAADGKASQMIDLNSKPEWKTDITSCSVQGVFEGAFRAVLEDIICE